MTKKIMYTLALIFATMQLSVAQNNAQAEKILSNALNSVKTSAVRTNFKLAVSDVKSPVVQTSSGTFTMKGAKFVLDMNDMKVWYNGKTQWAYVTQSKEVSITEPSETDLSDTNPMAILSGYKNKSVIKFSKTKSTQNYCIELIPKIKNSDIAKIEVQINKTNQNLYSIKLTDKKGSTTLLTLSNYQKGINTPDNYFIFNQANYKDAVINDLR